MQNIIIDNQHRHLVRHKTNTERIGKIFSALFLWLFSLLFIGLVIFIIIQSIPGFKAYGIKNILFSDQFNLADTTKGASVWFPLSITLLVSICAILFAAPIGIKTATFIKFRVKSKNIQKWIKIILLTLAGIPSVIFGLFALQSLGPALSLVFGINSAQNIITSFVMLGFIILPTIISLTLATYDSIDMRLIENGIGMGSSYTRSIYKIFKKEARGGIIIAIIISLGRALGETMAISMILSDQGYVNVFNAGFVEILKSTLRPLGAVISANMFAENGGEELRGLLYVFGIVLFFVIMVLNGLVTYLTKKRKRKYHWYLKIEKALATFVFFIPNQIGILYEKITYKPKQQLSIDQLENLSSFVRDRIQNRKFKLLYSINKITLETISFIIASGFLVWISLDIIINGIAAIHLPSSSVVQYTKNTTGQATLNTLIIIFISILIGLPIALFAAIYLNEYAKDKWPKKIAIFFIDSFGATPSIIFGMFGLVMFIEIFGISSSGAIGKSLLAGALTITLVILPTFTRAIQQALSAVPSTIRENAYGLGSSKWETITKLVLPQAFKDIMTAIVLTIGRIVAETAPLYLTAGLSSARVSTLLNPGQTLTTRIYAQLYENNAITAKSIMYESAFITFILVIALIIVAHILIPYYDTFKKKFNNWLEKYKLYKTHPHMENITAFKKQIYMNRLYLSNNQAAEMGYDNQKHKVAKIGYKLYKIKYLTDEEMLSLELKIKE